MPRKIRTKEVKPIYDFITDLFNIDKNIIAERKLSNAFSKNINGQIYTYLAASNEVSNFTKFRKCFLLFLNKKYSIKGQLKSDKNTTKKQMII